MDRRGLAWALYDVANSAFATTVLAGFFPIFFTRIAWGGAETEAGFRLGLTHTAAALAVLAGAPVLGAAADRLGRRKVFLAFATFVGAASTCGLAFVPAGAWAPALLLFGAASASFSLGNVFYDALLLDVVDARRSDRLSALGYALGYLGGGLHFLVFTVAFARPDLFGAADREQVMRAGFVATAVWWILFSLPLFWRVSERPPDGPRPPLRRALAEGVSRTISTVRHVAAHRAAALFLAAYFLYIDGVDTIVRMALFYGEALGLPSAHLVRALLLTQFVGFPATLLFGALGARFGPRRAILAGLGVYLAVTLAATRIATPAHFYALAGAVGLVQGAVQSLSRSYFARLVPTGREAEFFGFFNMLGKFAVLLGPALMGVVGRATGDVRSSIAAVALLFVTGGLLLRRVPEADVAPPLRG